MKEESPLYDRIGSDYPRHRRPDARIAKAIAAALGDAQTIINIGAGTGSYEAETGTTLAVEPSSLMIAQRPPGAAPCIQGYAEDLPLEDACADAAMAILTAHHWKDLRRGLQEMARVSRRRFMLFTWIPAQQDFWLTRDYFPEIRAHDETVCPSARALTALLEDINGAVSIHPVPIPHDCADGFLFANWRRPRAYLDPSVRAATSSFARIDAADGLERLRRDLDSGRWHERNNDLLALSALDIGYRIVVVEKKHARE